MTELHRQTGLNDVTVEVRATRSPASHPRRTIRSYLVRRIRLQILGLAKERGPDELDAAVPHISRILTPW